MDNSAPPLIIKRSSKNKAQRTRQTTPDPEEKKDVEVNSGSAEESPSALAAKLKNKAKKSRNKSQLSFGGGEEEGDGEVFQVKKSKLSKKMVLGKLAAYVQYTRSSRAFTKRSSRKVPMNLDQATISPAVTGPKYDADYLNQLKASTPTSRPPRIPDVDPMAMDLDVASFEGTRVSFLLGYY
jgi:GC-rich sequence DNA-binding factor